MLDTFSASTLRREFGATRGVFQKTFCPSTLKFEAFDSRREKGTRVSDILKVILRRMSPGNSVSGEMTDQVSEDWLPTGWTVEVKVRNNGKRDKYYNDPASGNKFNSRAEVSRYLTTKQISHEDQQKNNVTLKRCANDVVVEKTIAEGLPLGWIKEIRMTKKPHKIRRDSYYIDPVSEKVFRSMKDVLRYLENEESGRLTQKLSGSNDKESEDEKASVNKLDVSSTRRQTTFNQNSNLNEIKMKDGQILNSACNGEGPSLPEHTSDQSEVGTELSSLNLPEAKDSEQKEQDGDSAKSACISVPEVGNLLDKQSLESGVIKHESKKTQLGLCKSKNKKELNLPRRASKRLAGLEVGPVPELKTSTRARRVANKQSGERVPSMTEGSSPGNAAGCAFQQPDHLKTEPEKYVQNVEPVINGDEKQGCGPGSPSRSQNTPEEQAEKVETDDKAEEKPGLPDLHLGDFLTDPCIAFAIKTLTGIPFNNSRSNMEHSSGDLATPKYFSRNVETDNKSNKKQESNVLLSPGNLAIPEHGGKVGTDDKAEQKSGSPIDLPFGNSWPDPCIEFAIKTLTGAIPLDYDPHIEEYFQQQLSSSRTQSSDLTLKNVGLDNFCQTDILCQQFCDVDSPVLKKHALSGPADTRNASLHSSVGSDLNQKCRDRESM